MKALTLLSLAELMAMDAKAFNGLVSDAAKLSAERKSAQSAEKDSTVPIAKIYFAAGERLEKARQGGHLAGDTSLEDYLRIVLKDPKHRVNNHALTVKNAFGYFVANGGPLAENVFDGSKSKWLELAANVGRAVFTGKLAEIPEAKRREVFLAHEAVVATVTTLRAAVADSTGKGKSKTARADLETILESVAPTPPPDWEDVAEKIVAWLKVPTILQNTVHAVSAQFPETLRFADKTRMDGILGAIELLVQATIEAQVEQVKTPAVEDGLLRAVKVDAWVRTAYAEMLKDGFTEADVADMAKEVHGFLAAKGRLPADAAEFDAYMDEVPAEAVAAAA